jgi:hypothetical protein
MTTTDVILTADEWDKAMAFVLTAKDDEPESVKGQKPKTKRRPAFLNPAKAPAKPMPASHEDLHTTTGGEASLPDGSFMCVKAEDVGILVDKVKAADERNPHPATHPWWAEVKAHLARRAASLGVSDLIPADW